MAINNGNARGKSQDKYQIGFIDEITHRFNDDTVGLKFSSNWFGLTTIVFKM